MYSSARRTRKDGFTLIELMVAMTILAVGMMTVMAAQVQALRGGSSGRHTTQAMAIAQTQMEQLQRIRWTAAALTPGAWTADIAVNNMVDGPAGQIEQSYAVSWRVTNLVVGARRSIDVRVRWNDPRRPNRSITLSSIRHNHEGL